MSGVPITIPGLPAIVPAAQDQLAGWDQSVGITGRFTLADLQTFLMGYFAGLAGATFTGAIVTPRIEGEATASIAVGATLAMGDTGAAAILAVVESVEDLDIALISGRGGGTATVTIIHAQRAATFSTTAGNAGTMNIYYNAGVLTLQNNRAAVRTVKFLRIR